MSALPIHPEAPSAAAESPAPVPASTRLRVNASRETRGPATSENAPTPVSSLPALAPADRSLLSRYLALREDLPALAAESGMDLLDLLLWLTRPDIDQYVQAFRDTRNHALRQLALSHLESILKTAEDPIEKRRAATVILRALTVSPRRGECRPDSFGTTRGASGRPSGRPTSNPFRLSTAATTSDDADDQTLDDQDDEDDDLDDDTDAPPRPPTQADTRPLDPTRPNPIFNAYDASFALVLAFVRQSPIGAVEVVHRFRAPGAEVCGTPIPETVEEFVQAIPEPFAAFLRERPRYVDSKTLRESADSAEYVQNYERGRQVRVTITRDLSDPKAPGLWLVQALSIESARPPPADTG